MFHVSLRDFAAMTDEQILWLYLLPAAQRSDARNGTDGRTGAGSPAAPRQDPFADGLPSRSEFVSQMASRFGQGVEHWNAIYDQMDRDHATAASFPADPTGREGHGK